MNGHPHSPPNRTELRNFGLVTAALTAGIFGVALPELRSHPLPSWPWVIATCLTVPALVWPEALRSIHWIWIRLGWLLGWVNSRVTLTCVFFLVIVPMGLLLRAFGYDPVARKLDPETATYRVPSRLRTPESMEKPF